MKWQTKKLCDICKVEKKQNSSFLPYVGLENIESNTGKFLGSVEAKEVKSNTFSFSSSHVLYGRLRPYLNKVFLPEFDGHCSTEIFPIKPDQTLYRKFLFYWLTSNETVNKINSTCTGARMPRANMNEVIDFEIPLPPIKEQKHIVAILDQAFADIEKIRTNTEKNLKNARELFESYLQQVFSQGGDGWVEYPLGQVCDLFQGLAINRKTKHLLVGKSSLPLLRIKDLKNNTEEQYVVEKGFPINAKVSNNDIIYTRTGQIGLVFRGREGVLHNNSFKVVPNNKVKSDYLFWWLQHSKFKSKIISLASRAAQPDITHKLFKNIAIMTPPITMQRKIVNKIELLYEQISLLKGLGEKRLVELDNLKKSLLHQAFTGQLTKQEAVA